MIVNGSISKESPPYSFFLTVCLLSALNGDPGVFSKILIVSLSLDHISGRSATFVFQVQKRKAGKHSHAPSPKSDFCI